MKTRHVLAVTLALGLVPGAGAPQDPKSAPPASFRVDREKREVIVPCKMAPRKLPSLPEIYPIEVVATFPTPRGQKAHETVVNFEAKPSEIHKALESLGLKAGKPLRGEEGVATGAPLDILIEFTPKGGTEKKRVPIESVLIDRKTGKLFPPLKWLFTGSSLKQPDPSKPETVYAADTAGTLVGIYPVTDELVVQSTLTMAEEGAVKIEIGKDLLPPEGTEVALILRPAQPAAAVPASAPGLRAQAEAEVLKVTARMALAAVRPAATGSISLPPTLIADPYRHRQDVASGKLAAEESRPVSLPHLPVPRESAPGK
jgi:hypothetical protein